MIFYIVLSLQEGYAHYVGEWGWEGAGQVYCIFIYVGVFCMIFDIVLSLQEGYAHYVGEWTRLYFMLFYIVMMVRYNTVKPV